MAIGNWKFPFILIPAMKTNMKFEKLTFYPNLANLSTLCEES